MKIALKVISAANETRMEAACEHRVSLLYQEEYCEGDCIVLECEQPGAYFVVQFEDTLPAALIYAAQSKVTYQIPYGEKRIVFSPKSFAGAKHLVRARVASAEEVAARRCLSFNPYDQHANTSFFPHAVANVETRGEVVFAAQNAIDGVYENNSHGNWPFQSWGINRDPKAEWTVQFGRPVAVDEIRLTLRADFPHDNYWTQATLAFSDGSTEIVPLEKLTEPQRFAVAPRTVEWIVLKDLIAADDPSPFPALTQFEAWGKEV